MNKDIKLFQYQKDKWVTYNQLFEALKKVEADKCDVLLLHTAMEFGVPDSTMKRKELTEVLFDLICKLGVKTIVFPTFTFSFANGEDYDVVKSRTPMGMLNEYVRKRKDAIRSLDPLLSVCVIGENKDLACISGNKSLGKGSFYDKLHQTDNVKIAFFGVDEILCNTHLHYVEEYVQVPYRYNLAMSGKIIDKDGKIYNDVHELFVTYKSVVPSVPRDFYNELQQENKMKKIMVGNASISCFDEENLFEKELQWLEKDINCFIAERYDKYPLVKDFPYGNVKAVL